MIFSSSLQLCNVITSRFGNRQQVLRKRRMSVLGTRLCCTGMGNVAGNQRWSISGPDCNAGHRAQPGEASERVWWHGGLGRTYMC